MAVRADTDKTAKQHVGNGEQLLPGIPNEITIDLITPKLPWTAFHVLSCVSRCWQEAIQTNQVYEARVRANATQTLLVHLHDHDVENVALALYSTSEKCCYELPRIPCLDGAFVDTSTCIAMGGKLYVLGGSSFLKESVFWEIEALYVTLQSGGYVATERNRFAKSGAKLDFQPMLMGLRGLCVGCEREEKKYRTATSGVEVVRQGP